MCSLPPYVFNAHQGMARFLEYLAVDYLDPSYHVWNNFMGEVFFQAMLVRAHGSTVCNHLIRWKGAWPAACSVESSPSDE